MGTPRQPLMTTQTCPKESFEPLLSHDQGPGHTFARPGLKTRFETRMNDYPKRSPLKAIRAFCTTCQGECSRAVAGCADTACPFYPYRHGTPPEGMKHQPMKAIRRYCLDNCQCGAGRQEVVDCGGDTALLGPCPVFPFRLGKNPNFSAEIREKRRQAALERGPVGIIAARKSRIHGPFTDIESTKSVVDGL